MRKERVGVEVAAFNQLMKTRCVRFDDDGRVKAVDLLVPDLERTAVSPLRRPFSGDYAAARPLLRESLAIQREIGDEWLIAKALGNAALVDGYEGDHAAAYALHSESLTLFEKIEERLGAAIALGNLAHAAMHLGRLDESLERQLQSLRILRDIGDADGSAECLERLAMLANAREDGHRAARLLGLAAVLRNEAGTVPPPFERTEAEEALATVRGRLDQTSFDAAWRAGREMSIEEAIDLAGELRPCGVPN